MTGWSLFSFSSAHVFGPMALRTCSDDPSLLIDVRLCDCQVASIPECCGNKTVFTQCAHRYFICFAAGSQSPSASTSPSPTPSASECMPGCHLSRWCHVVSPLLLCYMKEAIVAGIFSFFVRQGIGEEPECGQGLPPSFQPAFCAPTTTIPFLLTQPHRQVAPHQRKPLPPPPNVCLPASVGWDQHLVWWFAKGHISA